MTSILLSLLSSAQAGDILLVGASYVLRNDLEGTLETSLDAGSGADRTVDALAAGGYTWETHVADAAVAGDARTQLVDTAWTQALLQEYTDIAVLDPSSAEWAASAAAGDELVGWLEANGAEVFLYMTWGDREGSGDYPDFLSMNTAVEDAYARYRDEMRAAGRMPWVAPVGVAWRLAYEAEADPLAPDTLFYRLYASDGAHPSELGSYLAACTMYAALTGLSPVGLPAADGVPPSSASEVQALAEAAVFGPEGAAWDYPWEASGGDTGGDTGAEDTGGDTGAEDTGGDDSGGETGGDESGGDDSSADDTGTTDTSDTDPDDSGTEDTDAGDTDAGDDSGRDGTDRAASGEDAAGCGCASAPDAGVLGGPLALLGLAAARRRRVGHRRA